EWVNEGWLIVTEEEDSNVMESFLAGSIRFSTQGT
ncbi:hypothetical protein L917_18732, partial [Phytophthora nicotianae]